MAKNLYNYLNNKADIESALSSSVVRKLLIEIRDNGNAGLYNIGTKLGIRSIISKLIDKFEVDGIITTELVRVSKKGRKRKICYLTEKGLEVLKKTEDIKEGGKKMREDFERVEINLGIRNRNALSKVKQVLRDIIEKYPQEYIPALISSFIYKSKKERFNAIQKFYKDKALKVLLLLQSKGIINDKYELTIFEQSRKQLDITDEVYEFYKNLWQEKYNANYYALNTENEKAIIEQLILEFGVDETKSLIEKFINDNDKFLIQSRHRISLIRSKILQYRTKLPDLDENAVNEILNYYKELHKQRFNVDYVEDENDLFKLNDFYNALKKVFKDESKCLDIAKSCINLYFDYPDYFVKYRKYPISLLLANRNSLFVEYMMKNHLEIPPELRSYVKPVEYGIREEFKEKEFDADKLVEFMRKIANEKPKIKRSIIREMAKTFNKTEEELIKEMYSDYEIIEDVNNASNSDSSLKKIGEVIDKINLMENGNEGNK
jgi:DNA-binding PadR family transcriptional regulator